MLEWIDGGDETAAETLAAYTAHEVRNPLAALRAMAQVTLTSPDPYVRRSMLEQIVAGIDDLDQFLQHMLYLLRPDSVRKQKVDVVSLLRSVVRLFAAQAEQDRVTVGVRAPAPGPRAWGNPDLLRHAFMNLLKNALEATPEGGRITLTAGTCRREGYVRVEVKDTGSGIPEDLRPRILTEVGASGRTAGVGVGLPFVRRVVEDVHGGRIAFRTRSGVGTVFTVEIPPLCGLEGWSSAGTSLQVVEGPDGLWSEPPEFASRTGTEAVRGIRRRAKNTSI